jgi:putative aldouronate transport system substrate-binding protein
VPTASTSTASQTLPNYLPIQGPKPDLPPNEQGLEGGYLSYPTSLVQAVLQAPGLGSDVTAFTITPNTSSVPPPVDQNAAWQEVNKQLKANMKMQMVSIADYYTKVPVIMAGGDLPDLFYLDTTQLAVADLAKFLQSSYADLSPYLVGDTVKNYPNLAAFPATPWKQTLYNGSILGVPIVRPNVSYIWYVNQTRLDAIGAAQPTNADDFKRILTELTRPDANQWGFGAFEPAYGLLYTGRGDCPQCAMFGVPNNWAVDANGKFTKDIETDQFRAAVSFVSDLYSSGLAYPDSIPNTVVLRTNLLSGKIAVAAGGWVGYPAQMWNGGLNQNPPVNFRAWHPLSSDGSPPIWHQSQGYIGMTAVKKSTPAREQELLRILNYLAAPFGSQEYHLLRFGLEGTDFNYDDKHNPVPTDKGNVEVVPVGWQYLSSGPTVLYNPNNPDFVRVAYADEQAMMAAMVPDPSVGLYSPTNSSKFGSLVQTFSDGIGDIVRGRAPLNRLDQLIIDWRSAGGDQMRSEYEQAYSASHA